MQNIRILRSGKEMPTIALARILPLIQEPDGCDQAAMEAEIVSSISPTLE